MHQLREITEFIQQALLAHQTVTNRHELNLLSSQLQNWVSDPDLDEKDTDKGNYAATKQHQLLQILIQACLTTKDYLTQLAAHRLLADCFSHPYLSRYLQENTSVDAIDSFAKAYHPTLAYTEAFVPLPTHSPQVVEAAPKDEPLPKAAEFVEAKSRLLEKLKVTRRPLEFLDETSLIRMSETGSSMRGLALLQLFSRKTQDAKKLQRQRVKLWLTSSSTWPAILKSLNLSPDHQAELLQQFKDRLLFAIQNQQTDYTSQGDPLLYSALLAKINPNMESKPRHTAAFFINQLSKPTESPYSDIRSWALRSKSDMSPSFFDSTEHLLNFAPCLTSPSLPVLVRHVRVYN